MDAAWAAGITTFDTADAYGGGRSESYIGSWLRQGPRGPRAARPDDEDVQPDERGRRPRALARPDPAPARVEPRAARRRRGRPLPRARRWTRDTPLAETIGAFDELVAEGKIRAYGGSNVDAAWLEEALAASAGRTGCRTLLAARARRRGRRPPDLRAREGLGYTPFSPLAGGWLTGKYRRGEPLPEGSRMTMRPEPYLHLQEDAVFDALEAFEARRASAGRRQPPSRSPGCSRTRR